MRLIGLAVLLSVSFLTVPLITERQQTGSPRRVGFLLVGLTPESSEAQLGLTLQDVHKNCTTE
jgi:hypothetical protein